MEEANGAKRELIPILSWGTAEDKGLDCFIVKQGEFKRFQKKVAEDEDENERTIENMANEIKILRVLSAELHLCDNLLQNVEILPRDVGFECEYVPLILEDARADGMRFTGVSLGHIFDGVCDALKFCHERHILHRDVAPANIGVRKGLPVIHKRDVVLFDFDLAQIGRWHDGLQEPVGDKLIGRWAFCAYQLHSSTSRHYRACYDFESMFYVYMELLEGELPWRDGYFIQVASLMAMKQDMLDRILADRDHFLYWRLRLIGYDV